MSASEMDLDSPRARRVIGVFGFVWNAAILVVVLFSEAPILWKVAFVVYGGFGLIVCGRAVAGKDDPPSFRSLQLGTFIFAAALVVLGVFVYRS
jgi:hypothetical protein